MNIKAAILALCAALFAAGAHAQGVSTAQVAVTPSASAYTAGYCLGGVLTVPQMFRPGNDGGTILSNVSIVDTTGANAAIDILIFNKLPTGTYTDNAACTVAAADQPYLVADVVNTTFTCLTDSATTTGICQASVGVLVSLANIPAVSSALWAVPIMRGTPTYGSSQKLYFNFKANPD